MADLIIKPSSGGSLKLQEDGGTDALTIDASGNTTLAGTANNLGTVTAGSIGSAVTGFAGIKEIDHWRLTADFSGGSQPITGNFERVDDASFSKIGTGMSVSSGIWTFPSTGIWLIRVVCAWRSTSGDSDYGGIIIDASQAGSGGTFDTLAENYTGMAATSHYANTVVEALLDVTNTTNVVVKFTAGANTSDTVTMGDSARTETGFMFIRIGDT